MAPSSRQGEETLAVARMWPAPVPIKKLEMDAPMSPESSPQEAALQADEPAAVAPSSPPLSPGWETTVLSAPPPAPASPHDPITEDHYVRPQTPASLAEAPSRPPTPPLPPPPTPYPNCEFCDFAINNLRIGVVHRGPTGAEHWDYYATTQEPGMTKEEQFAAMQGDPNELEQLMAEVDALREEHLMRYHAPTAADARTLASVEARIPPVDRTATDSRLSERINSCWARRVDRGRA